MNTVSFSCTIVLSYKCGNRNSKGVDHHPEYGIYFTVSRPCSHRIGSQGIDSRLDNHIGGSVHHRLQTCGKANSDNPFQHSLIQSDLLPLQTIHILCTHQTDAYQNSAEQLRQNRRNSRSLNSQTAHYHQENIQCNINQTAKHQNMKRALGISHCSQNRRPCIVNQVCNHSCKINPQVLYRKPYYILRCPHSRKHNGRKGNSHCRHYQARHDTKGHCRVNRIPYHLRTLRPVILGNNNRST